MIGCDNFCYYVVLAWRLFANGLLIFNLPQAFQKIFTYSFLLVVVHYLKFSLLSSVARWQMWVCVSIHLFSWQSLIFALKLENFHHFSICCCRTCPTEKHMHFPSMLTTQQQRWLHATTTTTTTTLPGADLRQQVAPGARETDTLHLSDEIGHVWHEWSNFDECHIVGNSSKFNFCAFRHLLNSSLNLIFNSFFNLVNNLFFNISDENTSS